LAKRSPFSPILPFCRSSLREFITSPASFVHIDLSFLYTWFHRVINGAVPFAPRLRLSRRFYQLGHAVLLPPLFTILSFPFKKFASYPILNFLSAPNSSAIRIIRSHFQLILSLFVEHVLFAYLFNVSRYPLTGSLNLDFTAPRQIALNERPSPGRSLLLKSLGQV
jgi:hypothetical protein